MTPIPTPELKARRSVIVKKARKEIFNSTEVFIKDEFKRANNWAVDYIESIRKFQNPPFLERTFNCIDIMNKCLNFTLIYHHLHITDHLLEKERFKEIIQIKYSAITAMQWTFT